MSSNSRKRPGSDSFSRPAASDKKAKPGTPRNGSENYISPRSPEPDYYSSEPTMAPPELTSTTRNAASSGNANAKSALPHINTNNPSAAVAPRSGSGSSTPQLRKAPIARMMAALNGSAIADTTKPPIILDALAQFGKALVDVMSARGGADAAKQQLVYGNLRIGKKSGDRQSGGSKAVAEMSDGTKAMHLICVEKETKLQELQAAQEIATQMLASVLSTTSQVSTSTDSVSDMKQMLDKKDTEVLQLKNEMTELSRSVADMRTQMLKQSQINAPNRQNKVGELHSAVDDLTSRHGDHSKRIYALEKDIDSYEKRTTRLEDDTDLARRRTVKWEQDTYYDMQKKTQDEVRKAIPLEMNPFEAGIRRDLKKVEGDFSAKHKKLEEAQSRHASQLLAACDTIKGVDKDVTAERKRITDLGTKVDEVESRFGTFETQISSQVKALGERVTQNPNGEDPSTPKDFSELSDDVQSHEIAIQALQKKVHGLDASQLQDFMSTFEDHKNDAQGHNENTDKKLEEFEQRLVKTEGTVQEMDKKRLPNVTSKLIEVHNRLSNPPQSSSPRITNANLNMQNGVSSPLTSGQAAEITAIDKTVKDIQASYSKISQYLLDIAPILQGVGVQKKDADELKARVKTIEQDLECCQDGIKDVEERVNNMTTDELVKAMVDVGLPQWKSHFPAATNFQGEVEITRREIQNMKTHLDAFHKSLQSFQGDLQQKEGKITHTSNRAELAMTTALQVTGDIAKIQIETKERTAERDGKVASCETRLMNAERGLGSIEPKVLQMEAKVFKIERMSDGHLDSVVHLQEAVTRVNSRLKKPADLPPWE